MKKISVIGFGKIGQAVVANLLKNDIQVTAIDINPNLPKAFKNQEFATNEPGLQEILQINFERGRLIITDDFSSIADSRAVIVCIPLLVDNSKRIISAPFFDCFRKLATFLSHKVLVVIETSIPIGFARKHILKVLKESGKQHGIDYLLAHSPERIKSGSMLEQLYKTPKVMGGIDEEAAKKCYEVYRWFFKPELLHVVSSIEAAEMIKLAGMAYRDINIAVSNQLAQFCQKIGINFQEIVGLTNTDGEAFLLQPGIGVGGHCTPVYPYFLIENFKEEGMQFVLAEESRKINDAMVEYAFSLIKNKLTKGKITILGLGFRKDVKEDTFSTAHLLRAHLEKHGFASCLNDPLYSEAEIAEKGFIPAPDIYKVGAEAIILVTCHTIYKDIDWAKLRNNGCQYFIDGRNAFSRNEIEKYGIEYYGIGQ